MITISTADNKIILSVKDLNVKFSLRGRMLHAIRGVSLDVHDVFRRVWDGKVFRVTSDPSDKKTPAVASLDVSVAGAEEWELPT